MAALTFETITAAQALLSHDPVIVTQGSASQTTVVFRTDGNYDVTIGGRTVTFGFEFPFLLRDGFSYLDGSTLFVGTIMPDSKTYITGLGAMYGGEGDDSLTASAAPWLIQGNQGNDLISAQSLSSNTVYGGQGADRIAFTDQFSNTAGAGQFVQGNKGDDVISGASGNDTLLGGQGNDFVADYGGTDFIDGNLGNDTLSGTGTLLGEDGNDQINGYGDSTLSGGDGDDDIFSNGGFASGGAGNDRISAGGIVFGDAGNDTLSGFSYLATTLNGGDGNDLLSVTNNGGAVGGLLDGGAGADTLTGGGGQDSLVGGDGSDTFVLTNIIAGGQITRGACDLILDWSADDHIKVRQTPSGYAEATATDFASATQAAQTMIGTSALSTVAIQVGGDVVVFSEVTFGLDRLETAIVLVGRTLADISADNFTHF